jgi:hypothetical protein
VIRLVRPKIKKVSVMQLLVHLTPLRQKMDELADSPRHGPQQKRNYEQERNHSRAYR